MRSIFTNVRVKNLMAPASEGSVTVHQPSGERISIYDAAMRYRAECVPCQFKSGASARTLALEGNCRFCVLSGD